MKSIKYVAKKLSVYVLLLVLLTAVASISGCGDEPLKIVPVPSRNVLALTPNDIIQVMSRAGFSDDQIIEFGPLVRKGLLNSGAVQVRQGDTVEALFAVQADFVYVSTRMRGSFVYNVKTNGLHTGHNSQADIDASKQLNGATTPAGDSRPVTPSMMKTSTTQDAGPKLQLFNG